VRRDEKQDLAVLAGNKLALKEIANYRYGCESGRPLSSLALGICQDTAHHSRATIWYEHFSLHALSINAGDATDCYTSIDRVVFNRDAENYRTGVGDLRGD
jgi:hypothetical protein